MLFSLLLTLFLVALNGFFVAAEFAIVKVRPSQINTREHTSKALQKTTHSILHHLDSNLAATQLGITLASLGLGWVGEGVIAQLLRRLFTALELGLSTAGIHALSVPLAFAAITFMHIIFGELAPKSIAIRNPVGTTLWVAFPLKLFHLIFRPIIGLLNGTANLLLKLVGIHPVSEGEAFTEEELKLIVTESREEGSIQETERNLIYKVFDFDEREVGDILVPRMDLISIKKSSSLNQAVDLTLEHGYSRFPVYEEEPDQIIGMIYAKDLLKVTHQKGQEPWINYIRPPFYVPQNKKIKDLLKAMQAQKIQMAFVVDEYGSVMGLLTIEDILEELVGEIQDEYDDEKPPVIKQDPFTYRIDGQKPISDINRYLPSDLPESDQYNTISGLALQHFGDFPKEGSRFLCGPYEIKILKTDGRVAKTVLVQLINKKTTPNSFT